MIELTLHEIMIMKTLKSFSWASNEFVHYFLTTTLRSLPRFITSDDPLLLEVASVA